MPKFNVNIHILSPPVVGVLFLLLCIPLQFLPGISSIQANYNSEPLTCVVTRVEHLNRLSACTWSSCSEGCTKNLYKCLKIRVNVLDTPWPGMLEGQLDNQRVIVEDARLFLNHAGCGYPPEVNCTSFAEIYGYFCLTYYIILKHSLIRTFHLT